MGSLQVSFSFRVEPPTHSYVGVSYDVPFQLSGSHMAAIFTGRAQLLQFGTLQPYGVHPWQVYVPLVDGPWPMPGVHWVTAPPMALSRGSLCYSSNCPPSIPSMVAHTAFGAQQSHPIPPPSLNGREGSSFPGCSPLDDKVDSESVVGIKPGDSGVVIGYWLMNLLMPG